jgi:ABC-type multidrug transport system ATPase subunit
MNPVIVSKILTRRFGEKTALDSLSWRFKPGRVSAFWVTMSPGKPLLCVC